MIKPLLFIGTGVGRSEIGLRWLLNQRKRNYQKTGESPKAVIIFENKTICCDPCVERELESLGLQLLLVDSYEKFWKEAEVTIS